MAGRAELVVAATATMVLVTAGCGSPSENNRRTTGTDSGRIGTALQAVDPTATGPAEPVPGAREGGTLTVYSQSTPNTIDPTDSYYTDSAEIGRLLYRTPTQYDIRDGKPVLVPDLTDLGTASADGLTWTFKLRAEIRYADGSKVRIEDMAYAIKRSFAHDVYPNGPAYQLSYFKDGDRYKGPYTGGGTYAGVETRGDDTLVVHLATPFPDLPYFMTFPMFTPIPEAKDTRQEYQRAPMTTGPYRVESFTAGSELKLVRNEHWDPATDPVRHQYLDRWVFNWGQDDLKTQQQVLNGNGPDADAINYRNIDASLVPQIAGRENQLLQGQSPCNVGWSLDTRKIPLEVRKAIAVAWPSDALWKAAGKNPYTAERASTILPPSVPGYLRYPPAEGLSGSGPGDPARAKQMLAAAGQSGFTVSWYHDDQKPIPQQVAQVISRALTSAGFTAKPVGVPTAELRAKASDYDAPVNLGQTPRGWCSDWPTGNSWFPVLFRSRSIAEGQSWGQLSDPALDARIDAITRLPGDRATTEWAALDQEIMSRYVVIPFYYDKMAIVIGRNVGRVPGDPTMGLPFFPDMHLLS